ncbi:hypothetical protein [Undibacterium sp. WLX3042]|uniref:hypothetical protein n=1 Tax=Undibacterium sp. WLX3042 TaxID=3412686 RepID=UPI003C2CB607
MKNTLAKRNRITRRNNLASTKSKQKDIAQTSFQLKDVEYYAASTNAWYNTSLEHDKGLLSLSSGGIGLLITLLTTIGITTFLILILYGLALISFLVCVVSILRIFNNNKKHLTDIIEETPEEDSSAKSLRRLDGIAFYSFCSGATLCVVIGIASGIISLNKKEDEMAKKNENQKSDV